MTFDDFINKYKGGQIDFDGSYGGQCVDLYRKYCQEVLGITQSRGVKGAADIWDTYLKEHFVAYEKTPSSVPLKGDVVIWNRNAGGGFGHVGVFMEGNTVTFRSFDQNWRALNVCEPTNHNYQNVIGWLRPIKNGLTETFKETEMLTPQFQSEFGVKDEVELRNKIIEHLGKSWGSENRELDTQHEGGYLGTARREIKELKGKLSEAASYVSELEENMEIKTGSSDITERLRNIIIAFQVFQKPSLPVQSHIPSEVQPVQETPNVQAKPTEIKNSSLLSSLLEIIINFLKGMKG